jgi:hypothetical protein
MIAIMGSTTDHEQRTAPSELALEVVSGLHRGVRLVLKRDEYRIGSTAQSDIILRDAGLEPDHVLLRIDRGRVSVEAVGGPVGLDGGSLEQGGRRRLRLPAELSFGEARLRITGPEVSGAAGFFDMAARMEKYLTARTLVAAGGVLCCAFVISVAAHSAVKPGPKITGAGKQSAGAPGQGDKSPQHPDKKQTSALVEEAAQRLNERLAEGGVSGLKVSAADGRLFVSGSVSGSQAAAWTSAQQWFDETYGNRVVLTANIGVGGTPGQTPVLRVQAIWFGESPYALTEDGSRYEQGAFLNNGWVLREIGENRIVLTKEGETFAIAYR